MPSYRAEPFSVFFGTEIGTEGSNRNGTRHGTRYENGAAFRAVLGPFVPKIKHFWSLAFVDIDTSTIAGIAAIAKHTKRWVEHTLGNALSRQQ